MINKKLTLALLAITATTVSANAAIVENTYDQPVKQVNSNADVTTYVPNEDQINYRNKNLANYQDPYLTNPRAYQSNEYGEAAPAPKANVFLKTSAPIYNVREAERIQDEVVEPSSGYDIQR